MKTGSSEENKGLYIDNFLKILKQVWEKNPALRFGQLVCIICKRGKDQFDMEDSVFLEKANDLIDRLP